MQTEFEVTLTNYPPSEDDDELHLDIEDGTIKFTGTWLMKQLIIIIFTTTHCHTSVW